MLPARAFILISRYRGFRMKTHLIIPIFSSWPSPDISLDQKIEMIFRQQIVFVCTNQVFMCVVSGLSVITQFPAGFHEIIVVIFHPKMFPKQNRSITAKYCEIRIIHFPVNDDLSFVTERDTVFYQRIRNRSFRFRSHKNSIFVRYRNPSG